MSTDGPSKLEKAQKLSRKWVMSLLEDSNASHGDDLRIEWDAAPPPDARPPRLGLGAAYVSHKTLSKTTSPFTSDSAMRRKLVRGRKGTVENDAKPHVTDESESRAGLAGATTDGYDSIRMSIMPAKKKRKKKRKDSEPAPDPPTEVTVEKVEEKKTAEPVIVRKRKRTKTRSKQKNRRRDNRPAHLKPNFITT